MSGRRAARGVRDRGPDRRRRPATTAFPLTLPGGEAVPADRRSGEDRRAWGFLSRLQVFEGVPFAATEALVAGCSMRRCEGGEVLMKPGEPNHCLYFIVSGTVRVNLGAADDASGLVLAAGESFGELSLIDGGAVSAFVTAIEPCSLLVLPEGVFWDQLLTAPRVARNLLAMLSARVRRSNEAIAASLRRQHLMERYEAELRLARDIQRSMLPRRATLFPEATEFACVGRMRAAREVAGDFYDAWMLDERSVVVCAGDACGKGVPAALLMARTLGVLRAELSRSKDISKVLSRANAALCENNPTDMFVSVFCAVLDLRRGELTYANAGHLPPLLCTRGGPVRPLPLPKGAVLGLWRTLAFPARRLQLAPRTTLVAYTDGVTEATNEAGEEFGEARLAAVVEAAREGELDAVVARVYDAVETWAGDGEPGDDCTVLALRYFG